MQCPRIIRASVIDDYTLVVEFSNHEIKKYDVRRLLSIPIFLPLQNPAFLRSFKIDEGGYGIVWNEDIDISEYELWKNGIAVEPEELVSDRPLQS